MSFSYFQDFWKSHFQVTSRVYHRHIVPAIYHPLNVVNVCTSIPSAYYTSNISCADKHTPMYRSKWVSLCVRSKKSTNSSSLYTRLLIVCSWYVGGTVCVHYLVHTNAQLRKEYEFNNLFIKLFEKF